MVKKYRLGFDVWSIVLFIISMLPTFIWLAIPSPNDILRTESITKPLDALASICQILMIVILCFLKNTECKKIRISPFILATFFCCLLYFTNWGFYYEGITNTLVILGLTIPPCLAFLFFAIDRKNTIALIPISIFTLCHVLYGVFNFIL
ncbi:MAG: hypothetical protein HDR51_04095 [Treponema sp.]|nr:hypothetical protein [Treponema sp.]